MFDKKV